MLRRSMRRYHASAAAALTLASVFALAACGGAPPPPPAPPPAPPAPPPPPAPDVSAVPEPAGLVVSGGMAKPGATLATVHDWTKLPMPQSEQLTELLTGEAIGPVVDVDQPVYFALTIVGSGMNMKPPMFAVSAAVKDVDKVKASLAERYKLVPGDNGVTVIEGLGGRPHGSDAEDGDEDDDDDASGEHQRTCELAPAAGDAAVRIVCGLGKKDVSALGPWLTRTAPRTAPSSDLHVDVNVAPLHDTIAEGKKVMGGLMGMALGGLRAPWAREMLMAAAADLADFGTDTDGTSVDFAVADTGVTETATLRLGGTSSLLARLAVAHPERVGAPPAALWQMPGDTDLAYFTRGMDEDAIAHARQLLTDAIAGGLVEGGVKAPDASSVATSLGKVLTSAPLVYASGLDANVVKKALATDRALGTDASPAAKQDATLGIAEALLGWRVVELDRAPAAVASDMKDLATALSKPSLLEAIKTQAKLDGEVTPLTIKSAPVTKADGLPAGTSHWVVDVPSFPRRGHGHGPRKDPKKPDAKKPMAAAPPAKPLKMHVFVVPDGQRTWIGIGGDEAEAAMKVAAALATGSDDLGARADMATLKAASIGSGGFATARGLAGFAIVLRVLSTGSPAGASELLDQLDQLPEKGSSPILFTSTPKAGGPPTSVTGQVTVPRGTIEDVVTLILKHGGF